MTETKEGLATQTTNSDTNSRSLRVFPDTAEHADFSTLNVGRVELLRAMLNDEISLEKSKEARAYVQDMSTDMIRQFRKDRLTQRDNQREGAASEAANRKRRTNNRLDGR